MYVLGTGEGGGVNELEVADQVGTKERKKRISDDDYNFSIPLSQSDIMKDLFETET